VIPNLFAVIRLQELQDKEEDLMEKTTDEKQKEFHSGRIEAFGDAEYILKYATCYTKDGFDKELASKLKDTIYFDGNKRYTKEDDQLEQLQKGDLPTTCPNCNTENVDWDWEMANFYDEQITNKATCPECDAVYEEVMKVVSWNKKE